MGFENDDLEINGENGFDRTAALAEEIERMARIKLDFQYEYRILDLGSFADQEEVQNKMNKYAKEGFSLREKLVFDSNAILIMDKCNNYYEIDDEPLGDIL